MITILTPVHNKKHTEKELKISAHTATAKTGLTTVTVYLLEICTALFDG